ncbi:hypothetical protein V6N11_041482 [Hibiscus sabdariffa]|uniref:Uncharacterized protein n=1 Tax=Hibiscus sabdariffa TaxID=183260 RepID=A0ABR2RKS9_9ROSI
MTHDQGALVKEPKPEVKENVTLAVGNQSPVASVSLLGIELGDSIAFITVVVYWSYTCFDTSRINVVICLMALALTMIVKHKEIKENDACFVVFGQIGMKWAKYLVSICALKGTTISLWVRSLGQDLYMTQTARAHMIPPIVALVLNIDVDFETEPIGTWKDGKQISLNF